MATVNVTVSGVENGTITLDPTNKVQWKKFKQLQKEYPEPFGKVFTFDGKSNVLSFCVDDFYTTEDQNDRVVLDFLTRAMRLASVFLGEVTKSLCTNSWKRFTP